MTQLDVHIISKAVSECADDYCVSRAYLFGSYARGEQEEGSDVDICIDCEEGFSLFTLGGLGSHLERLLGVPVDIVCGEQMFYPSALRRYQQDKVLVYEKC